ncbi:SDR family NAD(P)-dependent oxidoreductase [Curtobacterium sp. S6]|uniref:SDR family NAD(P)-dependent oxidoreductase n=1 Tax=Curtobacterium sp. S6 TaxID=1479623 RepID=UPI0004AB2A8C|nr:SDR family oxidoreductase [Curtobacterium sp. S6]
MTNQPRVALVTGANSGIGIEIARRLIEDGFRVIVSGRNNERGQEVADRLGPEASWVRADLSDSSAVQLLIDEAVRIGGRLDVLVNNAGVDLVGPILDVPEEEIRENFATNTFGTIFALQAAGRVMRDQGQGGAIINITSRLAMIGVPTMSLYSAGKGAVQALTTAAAVELAPLNIRVNAVAPGMAKTPLYDTWVSEQEDPEATEREVASKIPLGRIALPSDVAAAVSYLASPGAEYITGTTIPVEGGYLSQ